MCDPNVISRRWQRISGDRHSVDGCLLSIRILVQFWTVMSNLLRWRQTVIMRSQKKKIMKKHNEGVNQRAFDGEMGRDISAYNHSGGSNSAILASIKLQRWWRIHWYKVRRLATIQIQSWWRHICYRRKRVSNIHDNDECWPCKDQSRWDKSQFKQRMRGFRSSMVFYQDKQWLGGWDSFSNVGLISESIVPEDVVWLSNSESTLVDVGGVTTKTVGQISIDVRLVPNGVVRSVTLKVTRTPRMIDVLFGMPQIVQFDAVLRFRYQRIWLMDEIEMIFMDFIQCM